MYTLDINNIPVKMYFGNRKTIDDIFLSLAIPKGKFVFDKNFGCRIYEIDKITTNSVNLAKDFIYEALQWIIDEGRIIKESLNIIVERNQIDKGRLDILIEAQLPPDMENVSLPFYVVIK